MAIKMPKRARINISEVNQNWGLNFRENMLESYDSQIMRDSLAMHGQQTTMKLERRTDADGKVFYTILQGNRRAYNISKLAEAGVTDPLTGKPFSTVDAEVYDTLTESERIQLMLDVNDIRGLKEVELFYACEKAWNAGWNDRQVVVQLASLFLHFNGGVYKRPVVPAMQDGGKDLFDYHKGTIQTWKQAYQAPVVLREAFVEKLRGNQRWPSNKELDKLFKTYLKEEKESKDGRINRENPGPQFLAEWNDYLAKVKEALDNGKSKPKPQSMMNRTALESQRLRAVSRILKLAYSIVLREIPTEQSEPLDNLLKQVETTLTPEQVKILNDISATRSTVPTTAQDSDTTPAPEPEPEPAPEPAKAE